MTYQFYNPVPGGTITQTWDEHKQRAISMDCCWKPGKCSCYYYPGVDLSKMGVVDILNSIKGRVDMADWDKETIKDPQRGYGLQVRVSGSFGMMIYAHMSSVSVKVGDIVEPGQKLGVMGSTGNSTGQHVHWEWRVGGIPADPWPYVVAQQPPIVTPPPDWQPPDITPPPNYPPPPEYVPITKPYKLCTDRWKVVQYVYARSGPGTQNGMVGDLHPDEIITVTEGAEIDPYSVWLKHEKGWSAFYHGAPPIIYLRPEK